MEEAKEKLEKLGKKVLKFIIKIIIIIILILLPIILLAAAVYYIVVHVEGSEKEDDWGNVPFVASQYNNDIKISSNGEITSGQTEEEIWDKLIENGSDVAQNLDGPEELARLLRAEIVTQYPDTRPNPDEEIDWEEIIKDPDKLQGIVKFKRAQSNGSKQTMSYVSPEVFQNYIDEYNNTGSETAKQNALKHFTLKKQSGATSVNSIDAVAAGEGVMTDVSQAIIDATNNTPWPGASMCAKWVNDVYEKAGLSVTRHGTAYKDSKSNIISTDMSAIPIGAAVYGTGSGNIDDAGHVGIYIGGGKVIDSVSSGIKTSEIEDWIAWQTDNIDGKQGWLGWGWADGNKQRGTTADTNVTQNEDPNKNDDKGNTVQKAVVTDVSGDGYNQEYTSSAGITYKHFKQNQGSYAGNNYWGGTISSSGCGPTSIAILASGLTNLNYTPADVAAEMDSKYGYTNFSNLKGEMDSLGMNSTIIQSPSANTIKDNLLNGKVMLVSVNSNTIFTGGSHIMAIVDINEEGQIYICNPGSSTNYGWYDISEIMKGCNYIIVTEAGAAGVASTSNNSDYVAVVATWTQIDTEVTTNDPNVNQVNETEYMMTTSNINYKELVDPYTMPFDMLWALLVVGEDRNFIFDLVDLIYGSDIQITVHDNLRIDTDINEWNYTKRTKAIVNANITANSAGYTATDSITDDTHDPHSEDNYTTTKKVVTQTNTIETDLTRADVWSVDYQNEYTYSGASEETQTSTAKQDDQDYGNSPNRTETTYSCGEIDAKKQELETLAISSATQNGIDEDTAQNVTFEEDIKADYYEKYINITDNVTNTVSKQKYIKGVPVLEEKTDPNSSEPNFVTIFNKYDYRQNKSNIKDASEWLFEIIENNDDIADMLDLIKYMIYKADGTNYGVNEFDFETFYDHELTTVGTGVNGGKGYNVADTEIFITDATTLEKAFKGYSGYSKLVQHVDDFLKYQEKYGVNAVFAAAVSISETSAGRAGHAIDGKNNWFNIECRCGNSSHGRFETYSDASKSIERFFWQIAEGSYYFKQGKYTVDSIGMTYCEDADRPGGWIDDTSTYMSQMYRAAGITLSSGSSESSETPESTPASTRKGEKIVEAAKTKLGCPYIWGAAGPDKFDCSGLTMWSYKQVGINIDHSSDSQKANAKKVVSIANARVGDILWKEGHVGIYIGSNEFIHAPQPGRNVEIKKGANGYFTCALQFY